MNETMSPIEAAQRNLSNLTNNRYPGRGLIIGLSDDGQHMIQVYWIMGRSDNSRNRIFSVKGGRVFTEAADATKVTDSSLIIYDAMIERDNFFVVSNGAQTLSVADRMMKGMDLLAALSDWEYEPDKPNFTPRITGVFHPNPSGPSAEIAVLKKSISSLETERFYYCYGSLMRGYGYCVTTYSGDGNPLPSFQGEPLMMPIFGSMDDLADIYWERLDASNRVALAVKFIGVKTLKSTVVIVNRFKKV